MLVVVSMPLTARLVVVALVVVLLTIERLFTDEEAFEINPPVKVVSPETVRLVSERVPVFNVPTLRVEMVDEPLM